MPTWPLSSERGFSYELLIVLCVEVDSQHRIKKGKLANILGLNHIVRQPWLTHLPLQIPRHRRLNRKLDPVSTG